jgi:hypothetical protein
MRTTLEIADDVLLAAKVVAKREQRTVGEVISHWARLGLQSQVSVNAGTEEFSGFRPLPARGVTVSSEVIERLRDIAGI